MFKKLAIAIAAIAIIWHSLLPDKYPHADGILVPSAPVQSSPHRAKWEQDGYSFEGLAYFDIKARVLSIDWFWLDAARELSPVDFVMAWGPMSDNRSLRRVKIGHGGRYYTWTSKDPPLSPDSMNDHMANMHMVPASASIRKKLERVTKHDLIQIRGHLVRITRPDGWNWNSSLTREDSGPGACELVYVEELHFL